MNDGAVPPAGLLGLWGVIVGRGACGLVLSTGSVSARGLGRGAGGDFYSGGQRAWQRLFSPCLPPASHRLLVPLLVSISIKHPEFLVHWLLRDQKTPLQPWFIALIVFPFSPIS